MKAKTNSINSMFSEWITNAVIEKIIKDKFLSTEVSKIEKPIIGFVSEVKADKQIEALNQPELWFVNVEKKVDWEKVKKDIFSNLNWDDVQIGEPTETEWIIENLIQETSSKKVFEWIYDLVLDNASNTLLICTIMHALSHIDYEEIYPYGPMLGMAMLGHDDKRVVAFSIKTFSNWNSKDSLRYVKNFSPKQDWAKKEWDKVVEYIEENGDEIDGVFDEENYSVKMDTKTA